MQALLQTLQDHDLGHLRIIAELWGFDPPRGSALQAAENLARSMLDPQALADARAGLPSDAAEALALLQSRAGRMPLSDLARRAGLLRRMGPGKRDREKPWLSPASPLELLWYRGLVATAFADTPTGPKEFAFIPSDLMALLPQPAALPVASFHPLPEPPAVHHLATAAAIEDAATLLAALRRRPSPTSDLTAERRSGLAPFLHQPASLQLLAILLIELGILACDPLQPDPSAARDFLALSPPEALVRLVRAWVDSRLWNDLAHVASLSAAGKTWPNHPLAARRSVIEFLAKIPPLIWHAIDPFVQSVFERQPDFQRPGGDFDSWYLQHADSGAFLQGFEHWEHVEGALLRFIIKGPLHWLGVIDLGGVSNQIDASAFRLTEMATALFDPDFLPHVEDQLRPVEVHPDGRISVPRQSALAVRYQISRICSWLPLDESGYNFLLSPSSLQHALDQGLQLKHVQALLAEASASQVPPPLLKALRRWGKHGREAHFEHGTILRVADAALLDELLSRRATARFLGERLGPTSALIRSRDVQLLLAAAARFGLLIEPLPLEGGPLP